VSTTLQKNHFTSILKHIIIIGEGFSELTIFLGFACLFLSNMLLAIGGALEQDLFHCPLAIDFGFYPFGSNFLFTP
jgi:hypothetical protein